MSTCRLNLDKMAAEIRELFLQPPEQICTIGFIFRFDPSYFQQDISKLLLEKVVHIWLIC